MPDSHHDLVVIGAGSAGLVAAGFAARLGVRVALVERDRIGGDCAWTDSSFDAILCECSFCLFPDKDAAAGSFARLLRPDGRVAISDLTRREALPESLSSLLAWAACIADARPIEEYVACLRRAGLTVETVEDHDQALFDLAKAIRLRLMGAEMLVGLNKLALPGVDFATAREMAREALAAIRRGQLGYAVIVAKKTSG